MKHRYLFSIVLVFIALQLSAQHDFDGRVFKIGYRVGRTGYIPYTYDAGSQIYTFSNPEKDRIITTNWEFKLDRYSENVFYQGDLTGMAYYFAEYVYWLAKDKSNIGRAEKLKNKDITQFGSDWNLFDFKLAFGKNPYYFGLNLGYTYFGTSTSLIDYGGARSSGNGINNYYLTNLAYGFYGFNANYFLKSADGVTHLQFNYDFLRAGDDGKGTGIGIQAIHYFGDEGRIYLAPYLTIRHFNNALFGESGYGQTPVTLKLNSTAFGVKFGVALHE
jgi:hypothetical protein